jgi:MFS transporter, OPA family, sugar phosphate sensor protein UhpC
VNHRRRDRNLAWGLSWLAYATYYTGRKGFSVAKKSIHDQLGVSESMLGAIDTVYLAAYAGGQFVNGFLGDRIGARRLVGFGMLLSSGLCAAFGSTSSAVLFLVLFGLNGYAQSTGWPGTTRAMAEWTTTANRGTVMAFWATCYQVGGIAASWLAGWLLGTYGWRSAFFGPAVVLAAVGLLVLSLLRAGPGEREAPEGEEGRPPTCQAAHEEQEADAPHSQDDFSEASRIELRRRAQRRVLRSRVLWCYGASYFFIKFIRYTLLFWLPYYLSKQLGYAEDHAAYVSTAFEAGGIAGVITVGILSDRLRAYPRSAVAAVALVGLSIALLAYSLLSTWGVVANVVCLALVGAALFGPDSLICGAAAQDAGGPHAAAMATGFVNGLGSLGAILEGVLVPIIATELGWGSLIPALVGLGLLAAVALLPTVRRVARQPQSLS